MAAVTVSALRVAAPVARVSARKVAARSASVAKVRPQNNARLRSHRPRPSSAYPRVAARSSTVARAPRRTLTLPSQSRAQPVKSVRSVKTFAGEGDVAGRLEEALKVRSPRVTHRARSANSFPSPGTDTRAFPSLPFHEQIAEDCVGECAAMWDEVEELSQAASDKKPAPAEVEPAPISQADVDYIKETQAALKAAKDAGGEVDMDMLRSIEAAATSAKKVKVSSERLEQLEKALEAALTAAKECQGDGCAVEWETVEEISAAKSKIENTD